MGVALDPVKLLKQYFWWLVGAGVLGIVLGVGVHFLLLRYYPFYRSEVAFEMTSQITDASEITTTVASNEAEIERFIGGQVFVMTSEPLLLDAVQNDPAVRNETKWAQKYISKATGLPKYEEMVDDLKNIVSARSLPDSNIVLLRATMRNPQDATTVVRSVRAAYMRQLDRQQNAEAQDILESLTSQLNGIQEERRLLEDRMKRLLSDFNVTSLDERLASQAQELGYLLPIQGEIRRGLEVARDQLKAYEEQLSAPGGATYPEMVRTQVKLHPVIQRFEVQIADLEAALRSSMEQLGEGHRQVRQVKQMIASVREQMKLEQERLLEETFIQLIELTRSQIRSFEAAELENQTNIADANRRLAELKRVSEEYGILLRDQERLAVQQGDLETAISSQRAIVDRSASRRVKLTYDAQVPDQPVFPQLIFVVPAVTILMTGLMGGLIVLREVLEQRVRSPQDVALIPRARVVGVIPEAAEDPTQPSAAEHASRDNPGGVIAESIRQIRTNILKTFAQRGHKALLVVGGMPGSGASSLISNLASSMAAVDMRVLIIDANFRRPTIHKFFGLSEGPGLGEVLLGTAQLADAAQATDDPHLEVLTAGAPGSRIFERLTTSTMSRVLDEARATYDIVLVDSPPAIVAGDAIALANRCDASLLVVKAYGEKRGLVARVRDQLDETRADQLGVVINAVRASAGGYFKRNIRTSHEYQNGLAKDLEAARMQRAKNSAEAR